jgi:hypothetical protein
MTIEGCVWLRQRGPVTLVIPVAPAAPLALVSPVSAGPAGLVDLVSAGLPSVALAVT